jgi:hypothetical protein
MIDPISTTNLQTAKVAPVKTEKIQEKPAVAVKETAPKAPVIAKDAAAKITLAKMDTIDLSMPAQARLMQQQGLTVDQIALKLELDTTTVSRYLGE